MKITDKIRAEVLREVTSKAGKASQKAQIKKYGGMNKYREELSRRARLPRKKLSTVDVV